MYHVILDLFRAGTETTAGALVWIVQYLMKHPDIQREIQKEIDAVSIRSCPPFLQWISSRTSVFLIWTFSKPLSPNC